MSSIDMDQLWREKLTKPVTILPQAVSERIDQTLHGLPDRMALRRKQTLRRWAYAAASVLVIGGAFAGIASLSSTEMKSEMQSLPIVRSLVPAPNSPYERSVTDQGIKFTIRDIVYDGFGLSIDYTLQSAKAIVGKEIQYEVKVDGVPLQMTVHDKDGNGAAVQVRDKKIDARRYEGVMATSFYNYRPSAFKLSLDVTKIGSLGGKWSFDIPVEKTSKIVTLEPDVSRSNSLFFMKINKVVLSPVSTQVNFNFSAIDKSRSLVLGYLLAGDTGDVIGYDIFGMVDPGGGGNGGQTSSHLSPVPSGTRYLTIRPFYHVVDESTPEYSAGETTRQTMNRLPTRDDPIILSQGKAGNLHVTGVEYFPDRTVVHYLTEGSNPVQQSQMFWVEDDQGNRPTYLQHSKVNLNNTEQTLEFEPLSPASKLTFVTLPVVPLTFTPDMEMRFFLPH